MPPAIFISNMSGQDLEHHHRPLIAFTIKCRKNNENDIMPRSHLRLQLVVPTLLSLFFSGCMSFNEPAPNHSDSRPGPLVSTTGYCRTCRMARTTTSTRYCGKSSGANVRSSPVIGSATFVAMAASIPIWGASPSRTAENFPGPGHRSFPGWETDAPVMNWKPII